MLCACKFALWIVCVVAVEMVSSFAMMMGGWGGQRRKGRSKVSAALFLVDRRQQLAHAYL